MRPPIAPALVRRSALALAGAAAAVALAAPAPASAAESAMPTAQAKAYGMDWVPYIDPADLPPVEQRKVICLVDSGVEVNPDLPADRPEGPIVARQSTDGTSGLPGDKPEHAHGTSMASVAGAVAGNDWGTVGAWPAVRILSMRALAYDRTSFAAGDWRRGVQECSTRAAGGWPVVTISLSLGSNRPMDDRERALLAEYVARAHNQGINVLAAAGNSGANLDTPANVDGVLPVAAGDTATGGLCSYASYAADVLIGPGCGINISWQGSPARTDGGGSSTATAFASTLVTLLRTLRPDASWQDAEQWLRQGALMSNGRPVINGEWAARSAGLGDVVDRARARMTDANSSNAPDAPQGELELAITSSDAAAIAGDIGASGSPGASATGSRATGGLLGRLPRPSAIVRWNRRTLSVRLRSVPEEADAIRIRVPGRPNGTPFIRTRAASVRSVRLRVRKQPSRVQLQFMPIAGDTIGPSLVVTLRRRDAGRFR